MQRRDFIRSCVATAAITGYARKSYSEVLASKRDPWLAVPDLLAKLTRTAFKERDFDVTDYGAVGNNKTDCCPAFRSAILACHEAGGGRVVVPAGTYLSNGPIHLLSNVNLYLAPASKIIFGIDPADYLPPVLVRWQGIQCYNYSPLIYAYRQNNIAVTGSGVIDGQAKASWWLWEDKQAPDFDALEAMDANETPIADRIFGAGHYLRPTLFEPFRCNNVLVEGVTFQDSPFWTIHPVFCNIVVVHGVTVLPGTSNDDGCDPESCDGVLVDGCTFTTADDNMAIKSGRGNDGRSNPPSQNILIQNCTGLKSNSNGFSVGSEIGGGANNIFVQNCVSQNVEAAYYIKSNSDRGGVLRNIYMRSNQAVNCHELIFLDANYAGVIGDPYPPLFEDFYFEDMSINDATVCGIRFSGDARKPITNIWLKDITITTTPTPLEITNAQNIVSQNVMINGKTVVV
jgi:polygalacturonase